VIKNGQILISQRNQNKTNDKIKNKNSNKLSKYEKTKEKTENIDGNV
jgi:hypothetical protein